MMQFGLCPRCQIEIPKERLEQSPLICPICGYSHSPTNMRVNDLLERRFIKTAIGVALALIVAFVQTATWDKYALEIIPLKLKQFTGLANQDDLQQIAKICLERKRHDCVETAYVSLAQSGENEFFAELGKYQARLGKLADAKTSFAQYFNHGGLDLEASYQFAKVLGQSGQVDQSASYFDHVLKSKPDTLQVTVTQNYVRMLLNNGRKDQALKIIQSIRKTSPSASLFMEEEFRQLKQAALR